ncbi:hypothetical protein E2C01_064339 [Portunus trituberculatus]|uniref:Uncharacterized protein n=1 Tax=Portunus trituberculatus TaxID=210409 RepID=A0A5B7HBF0_PORTR|nr:hypothetical protein [Portunus trituberculatus]
MECGAAVLGRIYGLLFKGESLCSAAVLDSFMYFNNMFEEIQGKINKTPYPYAQVGGGSLPGP